MTMKAVGLDPQGRLASLGTDLAYWYLRRRRDRLARGAEPPLVSSAA
jgi:hypothetical protein